MHHYLTLVFAIFLAITATTSGDIAADRAALLAFRSAVGGRVLLWNLASPTPCTWSGIVCNSPANNTVVEIHFPGMGLSGQIPPNTLSNLTNLTTLSLRYNSLSGPIPNSLFASLTSLRNVYFQHNAFTGEIPESLLTLTSLVRVNFADNQLEGNVSDGFNNMTRLGTLYLQNNKLSGPLPDLNIPSLVQFDVSNNNFSGEIPKGLSKKSKSAFQGNLNLCGEPLDSCNGDNNGGAAGTHKKKKLSGGAIAGIVIGSVIGFMLLLVLLLCLCRACIGRKNKETTDKELEVGRETKAVESVEGGPSSVAGFMASSVANKDKEKSAVSGSGEGKRALIFLGKSGWNFTLDDLLRASAEVLGKGTFGTAYKAVMETGLSVAVKRLRDITVGEKEFREKMEEIGRLDSENLVPLRAYYYNKEEMLLVYDYLPMGSLSALLHGNKGAGRTPLNWDTRATIALGAARGISYIHSQGSSTSHGNIKSSNILLTKSYEARVSDFGLAQLSGPASTPNRVAGYRAPEVTDPRKISQKADVYSFGVLLLELLTGKAPTHSLLNEEGVDLPRWVQSVVREEWTAEVFDLELLRYYQNVEKDMVQLLQLAVDCTAQYPDNRPSMSEVTSKIEELCRGGSNGDIENVDSETPIE